MITYEKLRKNPKAFKGLSGLTLTEFDDLYETFEPAWLEAEESRLSRPDRRRAIGGGGQYTLDLRTQLLMVLFWLRLYLTTEAVGYFFGLHKSNVSRNGRRILQVLRQVSEREFGWPDPPKRGHGRSMEQALRDYPDLFAIVDATEQPVQRPKDDQQQRQHYSGKQKRHTRKTALIVNEEGLIRDISSATPGSLHDLNHLRRSGLLEKIPKEVGVIGDAGFDGLAHDLPDHSVATAHKARRNHPLTADQKLINRELASLRIIVEHVLCHIKHFKALAHRFRHGASTYDDAFRIVAAIVNRRTRIRLATLSA
jgi:IS5 family transposase